MKMVITLNKNVKQQKLMKNLISKSLDELFNKLNELNGGQNQGEKKEKRKINPSLG